MPKEGVPGAGGIGKEVFLFRRGVSFRHDGNVDGFVDGAAFPYRPGFEGIGFDAADEDVGRVHYVADAGRHPVVPVGKEHLNLHAVFRKGYKDTVFKGL